MDIKPIYFKNGVLKIPGPKTKVDGNIHDKINARYERKQLEEFLKNHPYGK